MKTTEINNIVNEIIKQTSGMLCLDCGEIKEYRELLRKSIFNVVSNSNKKQKK